MQNLETWLAGLLLAELIRGQSGFIVLCDFNVSFFSVGSSNINSLIYCVAQVFKIFCVLIFFCGASSFRCDMSSFLWVLGRTVMKRWTNFLKGVSTILVSMILRKILLLLTRSLWNMR